MFDPTQARERACLEAFERELDMPWALYRVRRLFLLSGDGGHRSPYFGIPRMVWAVQPCRMATA
ncbi:hypothetical protein ACFWD7_23420 [Streptomyces mirabilis]|uniref:hypothetical protein n=1 Tax=Streptomyces mirabilis TaxID=68239 RepID=UPI00369E8DA9